MKKIHLLTAAALLYAVVPSASGALDISGSVAMEDGYRSPLVNPAAPAWGAASGLAVELEGAPGTGYGRGAVFVNGRYAGYVPSWKGGEWLHSFYLSVPAARNLYIGSRLETGFDENGVSWSHGMLARPWDTLSIGLRGDHSVGAELTLTGGVAVRPFAAAGAAGELLELGLDASAADGVFGPVLLSLRSEPVEGIVLQAGYRPSDGILSAGLSLSLYNTRTGIASSAAPEAPGEYEGEHRLFFRSAPYPLTGRIPGKDTRLVRYGFGGEVREVPSAVRAGRWVFGTEGPTLRDHVLRLEELALSPENGGILFVNEHPAATLAEARELLQPLLLFRERGKRVVFYFDSAGAVDYLLAAASGAEIYLNPSGIINLKGVAVTRTYLAGLFERYGITVENFKSHPYKNGYDMFSEKSMSAEEREALEALTADLAAAAGKLLATGRGEKLGGDPQTILAEGPYLLASRAMEAGLIDGTMHREELERELDCRDASGLPGKSVRRDWSDPRPVTVALIHLKGTIHEGEGMPGNSIGADTAVRALRKAAEDPSVDALVLRIDSGGGGLLSSDRIAREVTRISSGSLPGINSKPVVVSMGAAAASGAYYIAAGADTIFARPETITGSIGVIALRPDISRFLAERKIVVESVTSSPGADFGSIVRPLSEREREMIREKIADGYRRFISMVAEGRGMDPDEVDRLGRGRIWSGGEAVKNGLVDSIGGVREAVDRAVELTGKSGAVETADYTFPDRVIRLPFMPLPLTSSAFFFPDAGRDGYLYSITSLRADM